MENPAQSIQACLDWLDINYVDLMLLHHFPGIFEIAEAHGVSPAQVVLLWNLQKDVAVISGSSNPDHIKENAELYHFSLTEDEMAQINDLDRGEKHDWY